MFSLLWIDRSYPSTQVPYVGIGRNNATSFYVVFYWFAIICGSVE